jgi:ascorbate-specific PTS system EIIC-type component UlaA
MILGMLYCLAWPTLLLGILVYIGALMQGRSAE